MKNLLEYLSVNKQEAIAICEGRALPMERLNPKELLQLIKDLKSNKDMTAMGYWG